MAGMARANTPNAIGIQMTLSKGLWLCSSSPEMDFIYSTNISKKLHILVTNNYRPLQKEFKRSAPIILLKSNDTNNQLESSQPIRGHESGKNAYVGTEIGK